MERKIKILIDYLYAFNDSFTKAELQRILRRLKDCGVKNMTFGNQKFELTNDFIKSVKGVCQYEKDREIKD